MLRARVVPPTAIAAPLWFDLRSRHALRIQGQDVEHLAFAAGGEIARLDILGGLGEGDRFVLLFEMAADTRMDGQMRAIRRICHPARREEVSLRLMRHHQSLLACDAQASGASLREIAILVLGEGDWPGDGEHRKSQARRLIEAGKRLLRQGPGAVLNAI
ncbi:DNA -binding domain-containing protein [Sphingobium sp. Leaf26]|uniref:DNA -binding domain-containing protein n=1 Tax=Sphingobium sp. Leaf26 TaxID=1735693 RepID=UPI00138F895A|nr:DUF2285 domain-containing protein [Sphingobium sp. Leaf26]